MKKNSMLIIVGFIMSVIALAGYFKHENFQITAVISVIIFLVIIFSIFLALKKNERLQRVQKDELTNLISLKSFRNAFFSVFILMYIVNIASNFNLMNLKVDAFIIYIYAVSLITFFTSRIIYNKRLSAE